MPIILLMLLVPITATALMVNLTAWPVLVAYLPLYSMVSFFSAYFACYIAIRLEKFDVPVINNYNPSQDDDDDDTPSAPKDYKA